jgi:hypothetical protein
MSDASPDSCKPTPLEDLRQHPALGQPASPPDDISCVVIAVVTVYSLLLMVIQRERQKFQPFLVEGRHHPRGGRFL